ncbi:MAG: hypothetical protein UY58_C0010G0005 [Candidatus Magasanikbacteria bacterium GW2011_GWA2_50_22]|uniref:GrpB family protein n=1 Tax=Candidatus Magasanikbacteria bacterium GW2011_GWA2_50_22 TaxID=1619043 RepID=A0A0G1WEF9_9BACT|nr:MAG: hypothetical protein UY58_C0010G0005 [Candidatus Magasanikbacteria bacterium GW2011_GWA2_50_22]
MIKTKQRPARRPLGLKKGKVILSGYNKEWPRLFRAERKLLKAKLGELAAAISHIGSTAVPGLCAKPILDIMLAVPSVEKAEKSTSHFERCGYQVKPREEDPVLGRLFFSKDIDGLRCFHLHVTEAGSTFCKGHLRFRNILRKDPKAALAYARLKFRLSKRFPNDRNAYIDGKAKFISDVLCNKLPRE